MLRLLLWNPLLFVWLAWCVQALLVLIQVGKFVRRIEKPYRERYLVNQPAAAVIVPFKGFDHDLERNARALLSQEYPQYRLIAVVEDADDPAAEHLRRVFAEFPVGPRAEILVAGRASDDTGQKVHNQIAALDHLGQTPDDPPAEVLVFADSDAVPHPRWLARLVGPVSGPVSDPAGESRDDPESSTPTGVATGYRWLIPQLRAQRPRWGSVLASVINGGVATFIGHGKLTQAWGGSMALRTDFARQHGLRDRLSGALSDDYQITRMCRDAGHRVYFLHHCLVPSTVDLTFRGLLEFGRRQYLITRVHDPVLYFKAVGITAFYLFACTSAWIGGALAWWFGYPDVALAAAAALIAVGVANQTKATQRRRAIRLAFGPTMLHHLRRTLLVDRLGTFPVNAVNLVLLLSALSSRQITWRGIRYTLHGPQRIEAERPDAA